MGHSMPTNEIARIERSAEAGWPSLEVQTLGPWHCRASHGVTHRANSVMTTPAAGADPNGHWSDLIERAEGFYQRHKLAVLFQISPTTVPSNLDDLLAARGYQIERASEVHTADISVLLRQAGNTDKAFADLWSGEPDEAWLRLEFGEPSPRRSIQESICRRVTAPQLFASIQREGQTVSCARGVLADGLGWVYGMTTAPLWRGRGLAARLLHRLAHWCDSQGAGRMYLQVMADNTTALSLYRKTGFKLIYQYHYRALRQNRQ
jgi:GNAT superfamily N-acetyltransferase